MASSNKPRGRPPVFSADARKMLAELIRQHGARGARKHSPIPVSGMTITRIAREFGITLKPGPRLPHTNERIRDILSSDKRRGRPPVFSADARAMLADLIRLHGARGARELSPIPVSGMTIRKIAQEFGITLTPGRRPNKGT